MPEEGRCSIASQDFEAMGYRKVVGIVPDVESLWKRRPYGLFSDIHHACIRIPMKFILALLIALSLIGSPGAAKAAASETCTMVGASEGFAADHEKMGCCTPECATPVPAAVLPDGGSHGDPIKPGPLLEASLVAGRLPSIILTTDDPPPRSFFA